MFIFDVSEYKRTRLDMKNPYRIVNADRTIMNAGTGLDSWFSLDQARKLVNYEAGQMIYQHDGMNLLWEVL